MSCNYADGLSPYENKGVLGLPEKFDSIEKYSKKCDILAQLISTAKHVVVHTGAGISTSAGIPDFRGPNGVWTLERDGKRPTTNVSFADAKPTKTHMMLKKLIESNKIHYIVSQNIDGLHLKSGLSRKYLAELHGNMFVEECNLCKRQFIRSSPVETVGKKCSGVPCASNLITGRPCRGRLYDTVLDWEHSLPDNDLLMAEWHSSIADLSICLGTTLQIVPSGNLPLETVKYGGKLVICNLQPTKHDNKADLIINYYVDDILEKVMNILGLDIPVYNENDNPMLLAQTTLIDWTIDKKVVMALEKRFKSKCKDVKKKRVLIKDKREYDIISENNVPIDNKTKIPKLELNGDNNEVRDNVNIDNVLVKGEMLIKNEENLNTSDIKIETVTQDNICLDNISNKNESTKKDLLNEDIKTEVIPQNNLNIDLVQ